MFSCLHSKTLGDGHPETIVVMHNLAESLLSAGDEAGANKLQQDIIRLVGGDKASELKENNNVVEMPVEPTQKPVVGVTRSVNAATMDDSSRIPKPTEIVRKQNQVDGVERRTPPVTFATRPKNGATPATRKKK